jgi:hypothetical protein
MKELEEKRNEKLENALINHLYHKCLLYSEKGDVQA